MAIKPIKWLFQVMPMKNPLKVYIDKGILMVIKITAIEIWQTKINGFAYSYQSIP